MLSKEAFTRGAVLLQTAFRQSLTESEMKLLHRLVADLDDDTWTAAVESTLKTARFFPSAAELREAALGTVTDAAGAAWADALEALRRGGRYRRVDLGPVGNAALRAVGGWRGLCDARPGDLRHLQREFVAAFESAARAQRRGQLAEHRAAPHGALSPGGGRLPDAETAPPGLFGGLLRAITGGRA